MDRQYVGIDFHRRRSVIVRKNAAGEKLSSVRVVNDPLAIAAAVAEAGPSPEVVIEATYGWYWIVDWLQEQGASVHLANLMADEIDVVITCGLIPEREGTASEVFCAEPLLVGFRQAVVAERRRVLSARRVDVDA
jgi:hypothetical protein